MELSKQLQKALKIGLLGLGIIFLLIGLALLMLIPIYVAREIAKEDYLGRNADGTDNLVLQMFRKPKYKINLEVWTFSVRNVEAVIKSGAKPILVEKGPYTFVESQEKKWLRFSDNDTRVHYQNTRSYHYSRELSCKACSLRDRVVVPNIIFQKLVDIAIEGGEAVRFIIQEMMKYKNESAYIDVSVGDLLFNGYKDPLVSSICDRPFVRGLCKAAGVPARIGLMYGQNGTYDGTYEIDSGLQSVYDLGKVYSWNNMSVLNSKYWYGADARTVNGTDGQLFHPNLLLGKNLEIFVGQICRSAEMEHTGFSEVDGIPAYTYQPAKSMNNVPIQRAKGFCNPKTPIFFNDTHVQEVGCTPAGLLDLSSCVPGNPRIYVSQSHFYKSPEEVRKAVIGVAEPSEEADSTFVNIEPLSGVIVSASRRSQLNVGMIKGNLRPFARMNNAIVPIIWMNETAHIDPATREQVMRAVSTVHTTFVIGVLLVIFGVVSLVGFAGVLIYTKYFQKTPQNPSYDPLDNDEDNLSADNIVVHQPHNPAPTEEYVVEQRSEVAQNPVPQ